MNLTTPPVFLDTDPSNIATSLAETYQRATGKILYAAQLENLWIQIMAYRESLVRTDLQNAACQCLADFATGSALEALGPLVGVKGRLPAAPAEVTWEISLPQPQATSQTFPAGWAAAAPGGMVFTLTAPVTILANTISATGTAVAAVTGPGGNGIQAGNVFSPVAGNVSVISATTSDGGSDPETDDQLRARIKQAPFSFSVAGPSGAYEFFARGAHPSIVDVRALNGGNGIVNVYPLCNAGLPGPDVLDIVNTALNDESVRPLCDVVHVLAPQVVNYAITAGITLYQAADPATVIPAVTAAAYAYVTQKAAKLGQPLIGSQVIAALSLPGVFKVELDGWTDLCPTPSQWASGAVSVTLAGFANV
jgi:phage-related baseplate assembly protein